MAFHNNKFQGADVKKSLVDRLYQSLAAAGDLHSHTCRGSYCGLSIYLPILPINYAESLDTTSGNDDYAYYPRQQRTSGNDIVSGDFVWNVVEIQSSQSLDMDDLASKCPD
eukprot:Gb_26675 [translate_table: standard]